jgi:two-component system chemotaxis response regulator CheY
MQRLKVLIAEDEEVSRRLLEASLTNWGHDPMLASDGEQARTALRAGGIDVCILDWEMPKVDGVELCRWIRSARLTPIPHVILLTSRKDPSHIQTARQAGANDYLVKPVNRKNLRDRLAAFLKTRTKAAPQPH